MKPEEKPTPNPAETEHADGFDEGAADVFTGTVGAPECGDVMRLQLKIDESGVIRDARFKAFGCNSAVASSSYITELLKGMNVGEADEVRTGQIIEDLSLPPARIQCSVLAQDAVKAAILDWKQRRRGNDPGPEGAGE